MWERCRFLFHLAGLLICPILSAAQAEQCSQHELIILSDRHGFIESPNYPLNYDPGACQEWMIKKPATYSDRSVITIGFLVFNLGGMVGTTSCNVSESDHLLLGPVPEKLMCGRLNSANAVYISSRDHVWLKFFSVASQETNREGLGFKLQYIVSELDCQCRSNEICCENYKCIYKSWVCNGVNECGDYSDELSCPAIGSNAGSIESTTRGVVTSPTPGPLDYQGSGCLYNEVFCYVAAWKQYMCLQSKYVCDGKPECINGEDENMKLCGTCDYALEGLSGTFTSPDFPSIYPNDLHCSWTIHLDPSEEGAVIQLRFLSFNLPTDADSDYVSVYDGPDDTYSMIGKYDMTNRPPIAINSHSQWIHVSFSSDSMISGRGFNATYQRKGFCMAGQRRCGPENDCFYSSHGCDGVWDCPLQGYDEKGCGICRMEDYSCGVGSVRCYELRERCNGQAKCPNQADEKDCRQDQCGSANGTFLCDNRFCIYEKLICDQHNDCGDFSDERNCGGSSRRVIIAAIAGSVICALLLVVLLGCSCKLYTLRTTERHGGPRYESPMSRLYAEFLRQRAPPPYHEAMLTSRNYDEVQREINERTRQESRRSRRNGRHTSRSNPQSNHGADDCENLPSDGESPPAYDATGCDGTEMSSVVDNTMTENGNHSNINQNSSTAQLIVSDSSSEDGDSIDMEQLATSVRHGEPGSENFGLVAHWSRGSSPRPDLDQDSISDDVCILDGSALENDTCLSIGQCPGDSASIETASASVDIIDKDMPSVPGVLKDIHSDSGEVNSVAEQPKLSNVPKYHSQRRNSTASLSSTGSETLSNSDVPLISG